MYEYNKKILIVEDSEPMALACSEFIKADYSSHCLPDLDSSRKFLEDVQPAAILLDIQLPDGSGFELVNELRKAGSELPIIVMTSNAAAEIVVGAMQAGADDFLEKPFSPERLRTAITNVVEKRRLVSLVTDFENDMARDNFEGFIGSSLVMQGIYHMVESAAPSKASVFITGESGTGKEVLASALHARSPRKDKPFVALNCGAIPKELIESEIFGHMKGAYTGAGQNRKGAALQADGGTLFLDEVCEMAIELQVKLLRFLQTQKFRPVGSDIEVSVDVRIVCATNKDPMEELSAGRFREDLYYRLHVIRIDLPPLRERNKDILLLAESLIVQISGEEGKDFTGFDRASQKVLLRYGWPGNVREMQNVIRQIVVLNNGPNVMVAMLPAGLLGINAADWVSQSNEDDPGLKVESVQPLWKIEELHISNVLSLCEDNIPKAAALIEVSPSTLYRKLKSTEAK